MTDDEIAALRAAAEAVTEREWRSYPDEPHVVFGDGGISLHMAPQPVVRAAYIAAASPAALLALLARAEAAEAQVAAEIEAERAYCVNVARATALALDGPDNGDAADGANAVADALLARGPSSALADALRQAEARGMREAKEVALRQSSRGHEGYNGEYNRGINTGFLYAREDIAAAIEAAADAKEKPDAE